MNWYKFTAPDAKLRQNKIKIEKDFKTILINMRLELEEKKIKSKIR